MTLSDSIFTQSCALQPPILQPAPAFAVVEAADFDWLVADDVDIWEADDPASPSSEEADEE